MTKTIGFPPIPFLFFSGEREEEIEEVAYFLAKNFQSLADLMLYGLFRDT